jgi:hypothetical protein
MDDISRKSYDKRKFPVLYAQCDFNCGLAHLYLKDDEFETYHFNYDTVIELIKENKINTKKRIQIQNAPLIN